MFDGLVTVVMYSTSETFEVSDEYSLILIFFRYYRIKITLLSKLTRLRDFPRVGDGS